MNCREFENVLITIAHEQTVAPSARKLALSHTESCARCAKRLTEARILVTGVRAVRKGIADKGAPARVEAALRNALRQRATMQSSSRITPAPVRAPRWPRRAIGAATALIMLTALLTSVLWHKSQRVDHPLNRVAKATALSPEQPGVWTITRPRVRRVDPPHGGASKPKRLPRVTGSSAQSRLATDGSKLADQLPIESQDAHALSDYIPLTYLPDAMALESGQVIRVKVPLSTFFALGVVPFGAEHADKLVNAELVIGDDGVQRAIRLVK